MLTFPRAARIFLCTSVVDMRKSIDGLKAIVKEELEADPFTGHLFVFMGRACDRVKILTWDKSGFFLHYKRLEKGQFQLPHLDPNAGSVEIESTQLAMLLDGIDYSRVRQPRPWVPSTRTPQPKDRHGIGGMI